jgi:sugar phosphate isomerase/epimerase
MIFVEGSSLYDGVFSMATRLKRRAFLSIGAITAGTAMTPHSNIAWGRERSSAPFLSSWSPPADLKRDLTPGPTPVRLACMSTATMLNYSPGIDITGMVKRIRDAGYTSANTGCEKFNRNPWLDASESEIRELKEALKKYDVTFFEIQNSANNIHPDPTERSRENKWTIEQMEAAERVGCPMLTTHVGSCAPRAVAPHPQNWTLETWNLGVRIMRQLIKDTEGMRVAFGIEPDPLVQLNNNRALRQIVEECGPRVKICFDPCNMTDLATCYRTTELLNEGFDLLGENILGAHAKDILLTDNLQPVFTQAEPGKGLLDYETYLVRLSRMKYPRSLLIEHLSEDKYPAARKFLEDTAAKVGVKFYT